MDDVLLTVATEERPAANMVILIVEGDDARNAGCNGDEHLFSNLAG